MEEWSEVYRLAGEEWSDLEAAASLLEDTKSAFLAEKISILGDMPVNRAEQNVKSTREWKERIEQTIEARRLANRAKVKLESIRIQIMQWNNDEANKRAEMKNL